MSTEKTIKPEALGGFRDFLPQEMEQREWLINRVIEVYRSFGFVPLKTPALERASVLGVDKPNFGMQVYRFNFGELDVSLRFDLTVPLSRVVAAYSDQLPRPFKRYQLGDVWRGEKAQAGRYREFAQLDADIVGSASMVADAEIISIIIKVMEALDVGRFCVRFNNRKILNALPEYAGFDPTKIKLVLRALDRLEKVGIEGVVADLARQPDNEYDETAPNLNPDQIAKIVRFIDLGKAKIDAPKIMLAELRELFASSPIGQEGIAELEEICQYLYAYGLDSMNWVIDLSVARGLDYYTGPVFETTLLDLPDIGSVMSGGRFDDLVMRFTGNKIPATGASVGVDRLFTALEELGRLPQIKTKTLALIVNWRDSFVAERLKLASDLRADGFNVDFFPDGDVPLKEQIAFALKRGIRYVILLGEKEVAGNVVALKDLEFRSQDNLNRGALRDFLQFATREAT
ncbi:MAG: histidine--tRNA ligase [Patescibacteria group bacterium]